MTGQSIIEALKKQFKAATDRALADELGLSSQTIRGWRSRKNVTPDDVARLTNRASKAGANYLQRTAIRPLVEFFPIARTAARGNSRTFRIFTHLEKGLVHPYRKGLKDELSECHGVYVFFDSRGQAIYAGKAKEQSLWKEMNLAFNRERGGVQKIRRVSHPNKKIEYRTSSEKTRQIREYIVPLHELAAYFSAYDVALGMINDLEALLVRSFANDLLNSRMEQFSSQQFIAQ